jgi:Polymer-forming cytoskeletal
MWRDKKPDRPLVTNPEPKDLQANQPSKSSQATLEGTTQISKEAVRPTGAIADSGAARLGPSLHVKGEISGSEDLNIYGIVEGLVQLDERKLTVGTTATVTADIIAGEVVVFGNVKGNVRANQPDRDQEGRFGDRGFDNAADSDRRRRILQGFDRDRQGCGEGSGQKLFLADGVYTP